MESKREMEGRRERWRKDWSEGGRKREMEIHMER